MDKIQQLMQPYGQALKLRAKRQETITSNIVNADTPGYQAKDMDFAKTFQNVLTGKNKPVAGMVTNKGHIPLQPEKVNSLRSQQVYETLRPEQGSLDNNTVDLDRERGAFAENTLKYEAASKAMSGSIAAMRAALQQ